MRRRKTRVVWLPPDPNNRVNQTLGGVVTQPDQSAQGYYSIHSIGAKNQGDFDGAAIALVGDLGNAEGNIIGAAGDSPSLSDLFNSGYHLKRVCGHIFCTTTQLDGGGWSGSCMATAGLQVMRVDNSGVPVNVTAAQPDTYQNQDNPWIWRRSWMLTNFGSATGIRLPWGLSNNIGGSLREGSFVDQKTARIIGIDERLFLCMSVTAMQDEVAVDTFTSFCWNLRFLGSLKNNVGNRRNASR